MWLIFYYILKIGTLVFGTFTLSLKRQKKKYQTNCFRNHKRNQTTVKSKKKLSKNKLDSQ